MTQWELHSHKNSIWGWGVFSTVQGPEEWERKQKCGHQHLTCARLLGWTSGHHNTEMKALSRGTASWARVRDPKDSQDGLLAQCSYLKTQRIGMPGLWDKQWGQQTLWGGVFLKWWAEWQWCGWQNSAVELPGPREPRQSEIPKCQQWTFYTTGFCVFFNLIVNVPCYSLLKYKFKKNSVYVRDWTSKIRQFLKIVVLNSWNVFYILILVLI